MKFEKNTVKTIFGFIAFGVGLAWLLNHLDVAGGVLSAAWALIFPFVLGLILAFLLNIPMRSIETKLFRGHGGRARRPVSFVLAILLVLAILALVLFLVIPQLVATVTMLIENMPGYFDNLQATLQPLEEYIPTLQAFLETLDLDWANIGTQLMAYVQSGAGTIFSSAWDFAFSFINGTVSFFIGLIFACYVLLDKERLHRQFTGLLQAYLPKKIYDRFIELARLCDNTFTHFVAGSCLEAVAIATIFCIVLWILGFPYALLIGVLIGLFSFIPIFGATIACVIGALLILLAEGFWPAIFFVILFLVIQQIDGNFIYPHIVGNSVGLPPIWVLVAVTLGASLMGVMGMLLFIPLSSIAYMLLRRDAKSRLLEKGLAVPEDDTPPPPKKKGFWARRKQKAAEKNSGGDADTAEDASAKAEDSPSEKEAPENPEPRKDK